MAHNKFSNPYFSRSSRVFSLALSALVLATMTACGGLKSKESTAYKEAQVINPLEVPPDLTRANNNASTRIPTPEGEVVSADDNQTFDEFKKYKEWEGFEAFRAWKEQNGNDDLTFEAYQQAQSRKSTTSIAAAIPTSAVAILSDDQNQKYIRIEDSEENVWTRLALSFDNIGATVIRRNAKKGYYVVRYESGEPSSLKSRLFSSAGKRNFRVQMVNDGSATNVLIQKKSGKPSSSDRAQDLLSNLATQLRTWANG
ncbi:MAG: outer membrane protein assembly factor BamC [Arenicellales bacterium WSBS_2016_MAG_OTU3]